MQPVWADSATQERRATYDRRCFGPQSVIYGAMYARRRQARRSESKHAHLDHYNQWLMVYAVGILLFSVIDATLTLHLLSNGAIEANPIMDYFITQGVAPFVISKMLFTSIPLILLTATSNYFLFGRIRIALLFPILLAFYSALIIYEIMMISMI